MGWPKPVTLSSTTIALRQRRIEAASGASLSRCSCEQAPAGGTELEELLARSDLLKRRMRSRAPTRHVPSTPWSPMRARGHWGAHRFPHPPKAHLARLPREGKTCCDEPECFPSPGSSSLRGDRSPRVLRPASRLMAPREEGLGRADAFGTFRGMPSLTGSALALGSIGRVWRP